MANFQIHTTPDDDVRPLSSPDDASDRLPPSRMDSAIRRVADDMHRLNRAIVQLVEAGATVELVRCSRHHDGQGSWGDQMQPVVTIREGKQR